MNTNIVLSLEIANRILDIKKTELSMLVTTLQETPTLSDELVYLLAEFWNVTKQEVNALEDAIASLEEQKDIFGKIGLPKDIEIVPADDYPDDQQPDDN